MMTAETEELKTFDEEAKEEKTEEKSEEKDEQISMKASYKKKLEKKDEEIASLKKEVEKWKNEYYRAYADMANLRKDIQKDHQESLKYRIEGFVQDLLQVLDSFDIALKGEAKNEELKNYLTGFQYVHTNLLSILENEGVTIVSPKIDDKFDEKTMQAIDTVESDGDAGLVKEVSLKGYKLYDHLIRPAMVKVSGPKKEENNCESAKED